MELVSKNKLFLIETLSSDAKICLQYVQEKNIITKRDYNNLNRAEITQENIIIQLLDTLINKGEEKCIQFIHLLVNNDKLQETFPEINKLFTPASEAPVQAPAEETGLQTIAEYKMSSKPRGVCLIINNMEFKQPLGFRHGSEKDEASLSEVFKWLGFEVDVKKDKTAEEIKDILQSCSTSNHHGDCFVCCILSHGSKDGVYGTDGNIVQGSDIYERFNGNFCQSLINKPKVFFVQACRGETAALPVNVQADCHMETNVSEEPLQCDAVQITIPADADFLVARSTVKGNLSFRLQSGSWFIQCLCEQLKMFCPKGEDIYSILLKVNDEISQKCGRFENKDVKQMPMQKITLRKKLVFRVMQ